jgi:hypothetical protein
MAAKVDQVGLMMAFEEGDISEEKLILLFQDLIDSGLAWKLQGLYGRTARDLIEQGLCQTQH